MHGLIMAFLFFWAVFGAIIFIEIIDGVKTNTAKSNFKIFLLAIFAGPAVWFFYIVGLGFSIAGKVEKLLVNWINK
jgi:hypothetical protein